MRATIVFLLALAIVPRAATAPPPAAATAAGAWWTHAPVYEVYRAAMATATATAI